MFGSGSPGLRRVMTFFWRSSLHDLLLEVIQPLCYFVTLFGCALLSLRVDFDLFIFSLEAGNGVAELVLPLLQLLEHRPTNGSTGVPKVTHEGGNFFKLDVL